MPPGTDPLGRLSPSRSAPGFLPGAPDVAGGSTALPPGGPNPPGVKGIPPGTSGVGPEALGAVGVSGENPEGGGDVVEGFAPPRINPGCGAGGCGVPAGATEGD